MLSLQSSQNNAFFTQKQNEDSSSISSWLTRRREALIYHLFCGLYLVILMMLLTLYIVHSYKSENIILNACREYSSTDHLFNKIFSGLFYTTILLASGLVFTSLKYVSEYEHQSLIGDANINTENHNSLKRSSQTSKSERVEEFIRRNSSVPCPSSVIAAQLKRNQSDTSNSPWLHSVRNEAYETHRRMSTAQLMSNTLNGSQLLNSPEIVIEHPKD